MVLDILEDATRSQDANALELVSASFLENLTPGRDVYRTIRAAMGSLLKEQLSRLREAMG